MSNKSNPRDGIYNHSVIKYAKTEENVKKKHLQKKLASLFVE